MRFTSVSTSDLRGRVAAPGLAAAIAFVALACGGAGTSQKRIGFELSGDDGQPVSAAGFRGKILVVHVFTTWSLPAQDDALRLEKAFGSDDRVVVVGVVIDREAQTVIGAWRRGMEVSYPIAIASDAVRYGESDLGETGAVPFTVVLDREGRLIHRIPVPLGEAGIGEIRRLAGLK